MGLALLYFLVVFVRIELMLLFEDYMKSWLRWVVLMVCLLGISSTYAWKQMTITKSDTLASVAEKYRPTGVSSMDMVIAIRNANPRVFSKASNFKPGMQLLIPTNAVEVRNAIKGKYPQASSVPSSASKSSAAKPLTPPAVKPNAVKSTEAPAPSVKSAPVSSSQPAPKPVVKKLTSTQTAIVAAQTNMTIKSLQDTVSSQTQTIEADQTQINELTGQLNIANQQIQSLQAQASHQGLWTLANLWLVLWLLTLMLLLLQYRKHKRWLDDYYDDEHGDDHEDLSHQDSDEPQVSALNERSDAHEPILAPEAHEHQHFVTPDHDERYEPQLDLSEDMSVSRSKTDSWEQVELDIPIVEHQSPLAEGDSPEHANAFEVYDDQALAGEQNDIIRALSQDVDNMEWHQALLEFYVKTNSQNGFKRHYQNMVKSGLMTEGDPLWEEVRKMYLNKWIYQTV